MTQSELQAQKQLIANANAKDIIKSINKFYIDFNVSYCYPFETSKKTKDYGVLSNYINKLFTQEEIDKIISDLKG